MLNRHQAAELVNEAFAEADVVGKTQDPDAKGFSITIDGQVAEHKFHYGVTAMEQRKQEVAHFRARLVDELVEKGRIGLLKDAPEDEPTEQPKARA